MEANGIICPLCKSKEYNIIYFAEKNNKETKYSPAESIKERGAILKCARCDIAYKADWPSERELKEGYEESIDKQYFGLVEERRRSFQYLIEQIERRLPKGKLLDVGCGEGTLVDIAVKRGWEAEGIEPNKNFVKWAKKNYGVKIKQGSVFNEKLEKNSYDAITLLDVIEHVPDPILFLKRCRELLKDGGYIVISTPNFGSLFSRIMKKNWFYILSIHLFYFTPKTINMILKKSGFRTLAIKPYYLRTSIDYILSKSKNYLGFIGKAFYSFGKISGMNKKSFNYCLGQMIIFARK